ncbi:MAG: paraquat-inducible membrane protein A [Piscirickettsiaceae bacterium]|nr:MAG: paraquat-inducible membrane protein A [Piscirickettsiaceae bacterium]PCI66458.1 MAG: paraquat-inducible membrane protein A [Piscirickettsiaceae bacterium]
MRKYIPVCLFVLSIVLLVPGLTKPLMTIEATIDKKEMIDLGASMLVKPGQSSGFIQDMVESLVKKLGIEGELTVFQSTRSLLATMKELLTSGHVVVGVLIGLFGLVIPLIKIVLVVLSILASSPSTVATLLKVSGWLSKWSMSDVFVMAVLVAFLAINANEYADNVLTMSATLHEGFYYFAAYCLLAIAASQAMERQHKLLTLEQET